MITNPLKRSRSLDIVRMALLGSIAATAPALAQSPGAMHAQAHRAPARLVQLVRSATEPFQDVNAAMAAGYGPFLGCVSGPDHGAMGLHYVNLAFYADGEIDATKPEALMYEQSNGVLQLVGVEFIVDAETWLAAHNGPPVLEGETFNLVTSPNRFNLPEFFELHVWAWKDNPDGAFVDWNNHVSCEGQ